MYLLEIRLETTLWLSFSWLKSS